MKRHTCIVCRAKRFEKFMKKVRSTAFFRSERFEWACNDGFCGNADYKQSGIPLSSIPRELTDNPGVENE